MMLKTLGIGASLVLAARSFLIPPSNVLQSLEVINLDKIAESAAAYNVPDPRNHLLKMDCPGCPFAESIDRHHKITWADTPAQNSLLLNFSVGADPRTLQLNGAQFYPPLFGFWAPFVDAAQVPAEVGMVDIRAHPFEYSENRLLLTSYSWHFDRASPVSKEGASVIPMTFRIDAIEGFRVNIPSVTLKVIRDSEGNVMIVSVDADKVTETHGSPKGQSEKINSCNRHQKLCRWKAKAQARIHCIKTCLARLCGKWRLSKFAGKLGKTAAPETHGQSHHADLPVQKVHKEHHHHEEHAHHKGKSFFRAFGRGLKFVMIPMLIGVATGFVVYAVGMALGFLIGYIWLAFRKFRGSRRGAYATVVQDEAPCDFKDVKNMETLGFFEGEAGEAPPVYKDETENSTA